MELALLVYVVNLIADLKGFLTFTLAVVSAVTVACLVISLFATLEEGFDYVKVFWKKYYPVKTIIFVLLLSWIIPSTQTMKYAGAAYLIQTTFESEFVQETVTLSQKAVIKQLQTWAEDNTDIQELIESVDIPLPKELTKKENINEE